MNPAKLKNGSSSVHLLTQALQQLLQHLSIEPEPDLPLPEKFSGLRTSYAQFKFDCELLFSLKPRTYARDFVKIRTAIFLLTGRAKTWAHQLLLCNSPSLCTWGSFIQALDSWVVHSQPRRGPIPCEAVRSRRTVCEPAVARAAAGVSPLIFGSRKAQKEKSPRLAPVTPGQSLKTREASHVTNLEPRGTNLSATPAHDIPDHHLFLQPEEAYEGSQAMSFEEDDTAYGEPMEVGYVQGMSPQAVQARRRALDLCFYCGNQGHYITYCPIRPIRTIRVGVVGLSSATSPRLLNDNPGGPCPSQKAGSTTVDHSPASGTGDPNLQIVPVGLHSPVPLSDAQEDGKPNHNPGVSLDAYSKTDPCRLKVGAVPIATPTIAAGSALPTAEVKLPLATTPSPSPVPVPPGDVPKEDIPEGDPEGSLDAGCRADPFPIPGEAEVAQKMKSPTFLKSLVASYAALIEPGRALAFASNLPDLRTPGLFDADPYTEDDPCPLSHASDGALVRTVDLGVYEKGLKKGLKACSKKSKKSKKKG